MKCNEEQENAAFEAVAQLTDILRKHAALMNLSERAFRVLGIVRREPGINALSIAESRSLPRETVRRDVETLLSRGLLKREGRALFPVSHPRTAEVAKDLIDQMREAIQLIDSLS